ncbi:uncharacterized protein CCDC198 isoform X7 [Gracilinanus agilis]|uniref:uncharacterized protein CCDC198 isoform X7 n=1 Tax=Gracilinanus agilis TaxID=191870 RepID=UPI001CFCB718|nr:uncharacterized protein CCDC198 isoform X7 [Gracilinanus agilis]
MGSKHSKAYPRVTKVVPIQDKCPVSSPVNHIEVAFIDNLEKRNLYSFARLHGQKKSPKQLPPLRETENGRYSSGKNKNSMAIIPDLNIPRPTSFDISVEKGETSIIKKHPPRRFQIFEPLGPQVTNAEKFLTHKGAETTRKKKAQAELKKNLHKEARINKHKAKKILENMQRNDNRKNSMTKKSDVLINGNKGNAQNRKFAKNHEQIEYNPRRSDILRRWSLKQQVQDEMLWDSSSTSSDELDKNERKSWGLLRTKTQRISVLDELLDQE